MLVETLLIVGCGALQVFALVWSRKERERKGKAEFLRKLSGEEEVLTISELEQKFGVRIVDLKVNGMTVDLGIEYAELLENEVAEELNKEIGKLFAAELK